jgi:hypothetical protein
MTIKNMEKDIAIVYMVAGLSSRFNGKIKSFAKVGADEETLIEMSLKQALPAGFTKIIFIVSDKTKDSFKEKFGNSFQGIPVYYALQDYDTDKRDKPWGTTDALCVAKELINCPFVVCNGDDIYGSKTFEILVEHLKNNSTDATIGYLLKDCLSENGSVNRGIFQVDSKNQIKSINETFDITPLNLKSKDLSNKTLCSQNIFALCPSTIESLNEILIKFKEKHKEDRKIEALLPQHLNELINSEKLTMKFYTTPEKWYGITNPEDEETLREELNSLSND